MTRRLVYPAAALAAAAFTFLALPRATPGQLQPPTGAPAAAAAADSLDGTWELVSVIEDGKLVPLEIVKQTMIKDARVIIKGPTAAVVRPDGKLRTLAFVTDPKASPKTLDVAGDLRVGGKGIYMRDGDVLMLCVRGSDAEARPTVMASLPGGDTFLMTFRRVDAAAPPPAVEVKPPPRPAAPTEDAARKMLVGTWGHQTDEQVVKLTLNSDGTFGLLTTYKKGLKKVFDGEDRTSGTWRLKDGELTLSVAASTIKAKNGQVYSYRITSINESEVIYVETISGQRRIEWKLR